MLAQAGAVCEVQADPVRGAADWKLDSAGGVLNLVMVVIVGRQVVAPLARLWLWSMSTGTRSVVAPRRSSVYVVLCVMHVGSRRWKCMFCMGCIWWGGGGTVRVHPGTVHP